MVDRREMVATCRQRLGEIIARSGDSRAAFARRIGIDRSTLAQILASADDRLPRAETLAAIAADQQVSVDWLLGLSQGGPLAASIMPQPLEIEPGANSPADERLTRWHAEAAGYKVRYVPSTLPDLLKTDELIRYEYRDHAGPVPQSRIEAASARLATQRRPESDMEVCSPRQTVESFARGEGIWRGFEAPARRRQLVRMVALVDEPFTVFGPKRVAIYVGHMYLVFNSTEHIRMLTGNFDDLIRAAVMQPPDVAGFLRSLLDELNAGSPGNRRARRDG